MKKTSDKYEDIEWNAFVSRLHKPIKCKPKKYYDSKEIFKKHSPPQKKHPKNIDSRRLTQPRLEPRDAVCGSNSDQGISTSNWML